MQEMYKFLVICHKKKFAKTNNFARVQHFFQKPITLHENKKSPQKIQKRMYIFATFPNRKNVIL
jgi:hypothetical protein